MATHKASAQSECACSPSTYEFTFDFSSTCPRPGGNFPPGVAEVTCFVTSFSADVADQIPVSVETISIIEADTQRVPIAQSAIEGDFLDGDSFTYSSVSALGNDAQIPQSIQLTITGTNSANSSLVQVWAIKFTNECDVYPVLETGETFGWTEFTILGTPQAEVCPAAGTPSTSAPEVPSTDGDSNPVVPPNEAETNPPTTAPETLAPTVEPTFPDETPEPTVVEVAEATTTPPVSPSPTDVPTVAPTDQPTLRPTKRPELQPPSLTPTSNSKENTKAPKTPGPTSPKGGGKDSDTNPPTIRPTMKPTRLPTGVPTKASSDSVEEFQPTPEEMSFSYFHLEEEDIEMDIEWGRQSQSKKSKKDRKEDKGRDYRGRVRVGGRRRS